MINEIRTRVVNINFRKVLPDYFLLSIGAVILAVNFDIFLAPFNIAPGGISGMAIIIHEFTGWAGKGMFSKKEHTTLFCTVNRPDVNILKSLVNAADPRAFVVIVQGQQAKGGTLRQTLRHLNRLQE